MFLPPSCPSRTHLGPGDLYYGTLPLGPHTLPGWRRSRPRPWPSPPPQRSPRGVPRRPSLVLLVLDQTDTKTTRPPSLTTAPLRRPFRQDPLLHPFVSSFPGSSSSLRSSRVSRDPGRPLRHVLRSPVSLSRLSPRLGDSLPSCPVSSPGSSTVDFTQHAGLEPWYPRPTRNAFRRPTPARLVRSRRTETTVGLTRVHTPSSTKTLRDRVGLLTPSRTDVEVRGTGWT